jgi:uncharacterized membrane protein
MTSLSVGIVVLVFNLPEASTTSGTETTPYVSQWIELTTTIVNAPVTLIVACLGLSFLLLTFLDRYLKKRMVLKKTA